MKRPGLLLVLLTVATGSLFAADKLEPPDLERYLRWGPFRVRPGIELSNLGYDDNIFFDSGDRSSDLTATLTPKLDGLVLIGSSAFLTFRQAFDYRAYQTFTDLNYLDSRSRARMTVPFRNFGVFVDGEHARSHQRPQDQEDLRPLQISQRLRGGLIFRPSWRTEVELGLTTDRFTHEDEDAILNGQSISERLDRRSHGARLEASYLVGGRSKILLESLQRDIEFDTDAILMGSPVNRDTRERRVLAGIALDEGGRLSGTFLLGLGRIDANSPELPDLNEVIGEFELVHRLGRSTRMTLEGERKPSFAVYGANSYYLDTRVSARATHYLNRLFGMEAYGLFGSLTFPETGGVGREDDIRRYEASVLFRLSENALGREVVYRLTFGHYERDSSEAGFDQTQNTVGIGARVGF